MQHRLPRQEILMGDALVRLGGGVQAAERPHGDRQGQPQRKRDQDKQLELQRTQAHVDDLLPQ